ncbi:MAG: hypothetical protein OEV42_10775 [Deltaproteobacteria bacterium]|nr:hypothetical protein [Deltaproteobacteria bacterium]
MELIEICSPAVKDGQVYSAHAEQLTEKWKARTRDGDGLFLWRGDSCVFLPESAN